MSMEKNSKIVVVEGKDQGLFQQLQGWAGDWKAEQVDFDEAREALPLASPSLVILNLNHGKEKAKELLNALSGVLRESSWAVSAENLSVEELVGFMRLGVVDSIPQPLEENEFRNLLHRLEHLHGEKPSEQNHPTHQLVSFFSPKGGVGVSFVALNLAVALAKRDLGRVLLADFVLQHGNIADFLDLAPQFTLLDVAQNLERLDAKLLENSVQKHRSGIFVLPRPKQPEDSECLSNQDIASALQGLKKVFNYVLVDAGHEFNALTISCLDASDVVFTVATPDFPSLCNTNVALQMFKKLGYSQNKVKLILNRWHMKGEIETAVVEKNITYPISHKLVEDAPLVLDSLNRGLPLVEVSGKSKLAQSFEQLSYLVHPNGQKNGKGG